LGADLSDAAGAPLRRFPAGGSTDIIARDLGGELEKVWGQPVIVENRAGANGAIATAQLAKLPADGQTLMMEVSRHITNPFSAPTPVTTRSGTSPRSA
jgi:tripartite-type tricarboxylate transporter receptor subunit TctC